MLYESIRINDFGDKYQLFSLHLNFCIYEFLNVQMLKLAFNPGND